MLFFSSLEVDFSFREHASCIFFFNELASRSFLLGECFSLLFFWEYVSRSFSSESVLLAPEPLLAALFLIRRHTPCATTVDTIMIDSRSEILNTLTSQRLQYLKEQFLQHGFRPGVSTGLCLTFLDSYCCVAGETTVDSGIWTHALFLSSELEGEIEVEVDEAEEGQQLRPEMSASQASSRFPQFQEIHGEGNGSHSSLA